VETYEKWLRQTQEELREALEAAEDSGWHHKELSTIEARTYNRILTWLSESDARIEWYDATQRK